MTMEESGNGDEKERTKRFWVVASEAINEKFRGICRDDETILREAKVTFAKLRFPESQHAEIDEMDDVPLREIVAQIAFERPDVYIAFLQALEIVSERFFAQEESEQSQ